MNTIKVPYLGKGYKVSYTVETIDLSMTSVQFINVYAVFVDAPELQRIVGNHFSIIHNNLQILQPCFDIKRPGDTEELNLKKTIAQQIMNNPTE